METPGYTVGYPPSHLMLRSILELGSHRLPTAADGGRVLGRSNGDQGEAWGRGENHITKGDEEGIQGPLASLFTHSWKLIPLESPTASSILQPSWESQEPGLSGRNRSPAVTAPPLLGETYRILGLLPSKALDRVSSLLQGRNQGSPAPSCRRPAGLFLLLSRYWAPEQDRSLHASGPAGSASRAARRGAHS